jgi:RHS repeat-associated protein
VSTASQTRTFTYDHRGFLLSESSPETSVPTTYGAYDARGHVGSMQNGVASLGYDYDFSERLRKVRDASTQQVIKSFDFATTNQPLDCSTCAGYSNGKLLTATRKQVDAALGGEITVTERYRYLNAAGRLSDRSTSVTVPSTSTSFFKGINFSTFRGYDSRGQVQQIHYPKCADGEPCATATAVTRPSDDIFYDYPNGWMAFVGGNGRSYASMTYQPNGLIATISHANGVDETWIGDASGMSRPCGIFATGHGTQLNPNAAKPCGVEIANPAGGTGGVWWSTGQYTYDGAGNIRQMGPARYTYDPVSRLVRESNSGGSSGISWSYSSDYKYDVYGNRIEQSLTQQSANTAAGGGDGAVTRSRTAIAVDAATNRLASASYDAAGNMLTSTDAAAPASYAWDSVGTMRSLTEPQRELHFVYTADDERIAVATVASATPGSTNSTTWTLRGFDNKVLRTLVDDSSSGGHQWSWKSDEIWRGSSLLADVTPAGTGHFILDHLGSPRLVTDESATANPQTNDFTAFGTGGTTGSGPMQFTGHERDWGTDWSRSLDYMHARYYSSSMGRFLSVDPAYGQVRSPQSWNAYTYVENNPMNSVDPTGMWSFSWIRDIFRVDDEITVHAFTTPEHSYEQDLTEWNALNRQLDRVGNAVRHETQNLSYLRPGDLYDEEVARHGAQAFIDGVIPDLPGCGEACDPFASHGYYDVNDLGMRSAQVIGSVTRDVEIAIALRAGVQKGGWLNSNRYLRIGFSRKGGMRVFRVGGKIVEFFNEKGKWDIWTGGKL